MSTGSADIKAQKAALREKVWALLEDKGAAKPPFPIRGRIPNFQGAELAAQKVRELPEWAAATTIFANPDSAQRPVREAALKDRKRVIMATPRLRAGYLLLEPARCAGREFAASTIKGAFALGSPLGQALPQAQLVITGCVAIEPRHGFRVGKGGGYGDIEIAKLRQARSIRPDTPIVTTVHELQIVDAVPVEPHDTRCDIIATPERVIRTTAPK